MKANFTQWLATLGQMDRRLIQVVILLVTLLLFVLGGGAPVDSHYCGGC
jgi:hypothetical protein